MLHSELSEGGGELLTGGGREGHVSREDWLFLSGSENLSTHDCHLSVRREAKISADRFLTSRSDGDSTSKGSCLEGGK